MQPQNWFFLNPFPFVVQMSHLKFYTTQFNSHIICYFTGRGENEIDFVLYYYSLLYVIPLRRLSIGWDSFCGRVLHHQHFYLSFHNLFASFYKIFNEQLFTGKKQFSPYSTRNIVHLSLFVHARCLSKRFSIYFWLTMSKETLSRLMFSNLNK